MIAQTISLTQEKDLKSRSVRNILKSGEILGISKEIIDDLIMPQDIHIFRLHINIMGHPITVPGCISFHNKSRGLFKGGIRIASDVTLPETIELSRLMTLKTALTELELGGAKTGIRLDMKSLYKLLGKTEYDPKFERSVKAAVIKEFAHHYRGMLSKKRYVPAPDMGTGKEEMVLIYQETREPSSVTGKPEGVSGWLPGRAEATGYGVYAVVKRLVEKIPKDLSDIKIAIQGFGNVGYYSAYFLDKLGVKVVAISDVGGSVYDEEGIDLVSLKKYADEKGTVKGYGNEVDNIFGLDVDILIPAAINDSITSKEAETVKAKFIVEGANFPTTADAMDILDEKGVVIIPDILANSGGVIASCEEYLRATSTMKVEKEEIYKIIDDKIGKTLEESSERAEKESITLDQACTLIAVERVYKTMKEQGMA